MSINSKLLRFISSLLLLVLLQRCTNSSESQKTNSLSSQFDYAPKNNLYSVSFSGTPTIKETMFPINGNSMKSETAELLLPSDFSFQRAESAIIDPDLSKSYNKESMYKMLTQYAERSGLSFPEINYNETTLEKTGTVRGTKKMSIGSKEDSYVTYFSKVYIRDTFLFIVTVGSLSDKFPTEKISNFLDSVRFNKVGKVSE